MSPEEYRARREWLRSNPHGIRARTVERELRVWERELQSRGLTVEEWAKPGLRLSQWFVAFWHDRPGQPLAGTVRHADRHCQHLALIGDEDIRTPTAAEYERLTPCGTCG